MSSYTSTSSAASTTRSPESSYTSTSAAASSTRSPEHSCSSTSVAATTSRPPEPSCTFTSVAAPTAWPPQFSCTSTSAATPTTYPPLSSCHPTPIFKIDSNITPIVIPPLQPLCLTIEEVGAEVRRLQLGRVAGPDGVCPRLLGDCAGQLAVPLQRLYNMSLQMEKVPVLWKTSCLMPKLGQLVELNDYRL